MANSPITTGRGWQRARAVRLMCVAVMMGLFLLPGCVRRRLHVRTNPPGALVYVDNQQIGTTPCSVDFTYYGTREIRLIKPGYETLTVNQPIPTPWYQIPPIDFVSENLVPYKIRDNRTVTYELAPQLIVPREQLLERANELRQSTEQFPVVPAGAVTVGPPSATGPAAVGGPAVAVPSAVAPSAQPPGPAPVGPPPSGSAPIFGPPPSGVPFPPPMVTAPPSGPAIVPPP